MATNTMREFSESYQMIIDLADELYERLITELGSDAEEAEKLVRNATNGGIRNARERMEEEHDRARGFEDHQ